MPPSTHHVLPSTNSMAGALLAMLDMRLQPMEDVPKLRVKVEIPTAKHSMLIISVFSAQKVLFSTLLEYA